MDSPVSRGEKGGVGVRGDDAGTRPPRAASPRLPAGACRRSGYTLSAPGAGQAAGRPWGPPRRVWERVGRAGCSAWAPPAPRLLRTSLVPGISQSRRRSAWQRETRSRPAWGPISAISRAQPACRGVPGHLYAPRGARGPGALRRWARLRAPSPLARAPRPAWSIDLKVRNGPASRIRFPLAPSGKNGFFYI